MLYRTDWVCNLYLTDASLPEDRVELIVFSSSKELLPQCRQQLDIACIRNVKVRSRVLEGMVGGRVCVCVYAWWGVEGLGAMKGTGAVLPHWCKQQLEIVCIRKSRCDCRVLEGTVGVHGCVWWGMGG